MGNFEEYLENNPELKAYVKRLEEENDRLHRIQKTLSEENIELRSKEDRDPLTGIWNRGYFDSKLAICFQEAMESGSHLSLIFFDIDHFKNYNDDFGHPAGDKLLKELVALTRRNSEDRPDDQICRYGGEEFTIILPDTDLDGAYKVASRLLERVKKNKFERFVTLSAGVSSVSNTAILASDMVEYADKALYRAKKDGKDRVYFAV